MDKFHKKLETIINKLNCDDILKKRIKESIINDVNKPSFNLKTYNLRKKVKEYYDNELKYFIITIKRRLKTSEDIDEENMDKMSNALEEFINNYLLNYKKADKLFKYVDKLFDLIFPVKIKKISMEEWIKKSTIIIDKLTIIIEKYISSMHDNIYLNHIKISKTQLINLMYNYMNKHDIKEERLNLYIDINKHATNKQISSKTSLPIMLKHIFYKSNTTDMESYVGKISFGYDIIHIICNIFIKKYKSKSK